MRTAKLCPLTLRFPKCNKTDQTMQCNTDLIQYKVSFALHLDLVQDLVSGTEHLQVAEETVLPDGVLVALLTASSKFTYFNIRE